MRTLLILNDNSDQAVHAAVFALDLAQQIKANVVVASLSTQDDLVDFEDLQLETNGSLVLQRSELMKILLAHKKEYSDFLPVIQEIELEKFTGNELFQLTIDKEIYLVICGIDEFHSSALRKIKFSMEMLQSKVNCPLLIVPSSWSFNSFKELMYFTDLRFCCLKKIGFMADFAVEWKANIVIAHSTASGLPEIDSQEANDIFIDEVFNRINYKNLALNLINKEEIPDMIKMVVQELRTDLLIFVYKHFHFNTFTKQYFKDKCHLYNPVPMLIFPY